MNGFLSFFANFNSFVSYSFYSSFVVMKTMSLFHHMWDQQDDDGSEENNIGHMQLLRNRVCEGTLFYLGHSAVSFECDTFFEFYVLLSSFSSPVFGLFHHLMANI